MAQSARTPLNLVPCYEPRYSGDVLAERITTTDLKPSQGSDPESGVGSPTIAAVDDHLRLTEVAQSGNGPVASADEVPWTTAIGPTGILIVSVDGHAAWLGVPAD